VYFCRWEVQALQLSLRTKKGGGCQAERMFLSLGYGTSTAAFFKQQIMWTHYYYYYYY
jgi:hypothetical protein